MSSPKNVLNSTSLSDALSSDSNIGSVLLLGTSFIKNPKLRSTLAAASVGFTVGKKVFDKVKEYRAERLYTIKIFENDDMYETLQQWFMSSIPDVDQRTVIARTSYAHGGESFDGQMEAVQPASYSNESRIAEVSVFYDGSRKQQVKIDGYTVSIIVGADEKAVIGDNDDVSFRVRGQKYIRIECQSVDARNAVLSRLKIESQNKIKERKPRFFSVDRWGEFTHNKTMPLRQRESVILKDGQIDRIIDDLRLFLEQEPQYINLGIPYHRGMLLYGPPGTGKTSVASIISSVLKLDVYYIALSSVKDDSTLNSLLSSVKERSVLLLEDVDIAHATTERSDEKIGITLSGLLNALDGFVTPHGLITIMTTNFIDVLDDALIRPGRIDIIEEITYIDYQQLVDMCMQFLEHIPENLPQVSTDDMITPSEIVEVFKRYLADSHENAGRALVEELDSRLSIKIEKKC